MRWACALMLSGCSFAGVHEPTSGPIDRHVDCRNVLPYVDAYGAVILGGIAAALVVAADAAHRQTGDPFGDAISAALDDAVLGTLALGAGGVGAALAASSAYGFYDVHACRAHIDAEVASMRDEAREAARSGRCDEVVEIRDRLGLVGRELVVYEPGTRVCFPYYCATSDAGYCTCSHDERDCEAAVRAGLARTCVPERADVCT